jgi:hypothetical protein
LGEASGAFKPGDRVRKQDGTTATVVEAPRYYDRADGDPFTGWAVLIEPDLHPGLELTRIERGLPPIQEYARVERLALISD